MTREEAIKTLRELWRETNDNWYEEAYDMAIEALLANTKTVYCLECKYQHECVQYIMVGDRNEIIHSCSYGERRKP